MSVRKQALVMGGFALAMWVLTIATVQARPMSMHERFRIADRTLHEAMGGKADWEDAIALYAYLTRIAEKADHLERAYLGLAEAHTGRKDYDRAISAFDQALRQNGSRRDWTLFRKAMILMAASADNPSSARARSIRNQAIETYRQLVDEHPDSKRAPQALFFVANNQLIHHRSRSRAMAAYRELIESYPESDEAKHAAQFLTILPKLSDEQIREFFR